ncbi:DUF6904 family protein [Oxobacter pfennigii]|uniref:DUF6904 family protein n=1 Tax=Oxobacter pfennigii TaxID=36849 RepID=UPI0006D441F3|nr:hypothetical protein [Oxobacter pfennigii]
MELVENHMDEDKMKRHGVITPKSNVYYSCNCFYPEIFFIMIALNELIKLRIMDLTKTKYLYREAMDRKVIWDETIAILRLFQAEFVKCIKETFSAPVFSRWMNLLNADYIHIQEIAGQYIDLLNIKYINMTREKRLKNLSTIVRRIAEFRYDNEHNEIKEVVIEVAKEYNCEPGAIRLQEVEHPENIEW